MLPRPSHARLVPTTAAWALAALGLSQLCACSGSGPGPRQDFDHGQYVPKRFDPSMIPAGSSRSLPAQDPSLETEASRLSATPRTQYVAIASAFEDTAELLTTDDVDGARARLREIASATDEYHGELLALIETADTVDVVHLELLLGAAYYPDTSRDRLEQTASRLARRTDPLSRILRKRILSNLEVARGLGAWTNRILAEGIRKCSDLDAPGGLRLLGAAFPGPTAKAAFDAFGTRLEELSAEVSHAQKHELAAIAKLKRLFPLAAELTAELFDESSRRDARQLIALIGGYPPGQALDALIASIAPRLQGPISVEEARTLVHALDSDAAIRDAAPLLIGMLPELKARGLNRIATAIVAGPARDEVILGSLDALTELTRGEARALLALFHMPSSEQEAARALEPKLLPEEGP